MANPTVEEIEERAAARRKVIEDTWDERIQEAERLQVAADNAVPHPLIEKCVYALDRTDGPRGPYWDAARVVIGALVDAGVKFDLAEAR